MASRRIESFEGTGHVYRSGEWSVLCRARYRLGTWRPVLSTGGAQETLGHPTIEGELVATQGVSLVGRLDLQLQLEDGRWLDFVMTSPGAVQGLGALRDER